MQESTSQLIKENLRRTLSDIFFTEESPTFHSYLRKKVKNVQYASKPLSWKQNGIVQLRARSM